MSDIEWPEGATHRITGAWIGSCGTWFYKWVDGIGYLYEGGSWNKDPRNMPLKEYLRTVGYAVIERPKEPEPYKPEVGEWCEVESDMKDVWVKAMYVGVDSIGSHVFDVEKRHLWRIDSIDILVRPIKSEREQFIYKFYGMDAGQMYDNGARFTDE